MFDEVKALSYARKRGVPFYSYTQEQRLIEFIKICKSNFSNGIVGDEILQILNGLGLCWSYFPHHWSVPVGKMKRPIDIFNDDELLTKALISRHKWGGKFNSDGSTSDSNLRKAIRTASGVQAVSNFRPASAATIYYNYAKNGIVWDMSCGFGGRLIGAFASNVVKKYIGTEPSTENFKGLKNIEKDFKIINPLKDLFSKNMEVELYKIGSEDFIPKEKVDLCFTSPPYFNTEQYSDEETQSFKKFPTQETWLNGFLKSTMMNCKSCLKKDGKMLINIANVKTFKNLEEETVRISIELGFKLETILKLRLSSLFNGGFKHEPVFVFSPPQPLDIKG
tara:strand:- start:22 stop:1029 length:1008 start_codon:yes stop_codon:yes gene_type:complete